jgi:hypothetical protein
MKNSRQIAAAIDLRVRQLGAQTASDSALIDQMVGYMADLQRLWVSTTDVELATLCEQCSRIVRRANVASRAVAPGRRNSGPRIHHWPDGTCVDHKGRRGRQQHSQLRQQRLPRRIDAQ